MSVNIQGWNDSYQNFESQVQEFNKKIQNYSIKPEELDKIYTIVKREVARLKEFVITAEERERELNNASCCGHSSKTIWTIGLLNGASKVFSIGGAVLAIFEDNPTLKWLGVGAFAAGEVFDSATTIYEAKIALDGEEITGLSKLNKQGVEHAEIFKNFLKELKKIKKIEKELIKANESLEKTSLAQSVIIDFNNANKVKKKESHKNEEGASSFEKLDQQISSCLHYYEELPASYRPDDLYCHIISMCIQQLPSDDPLRIGLTSLENKQVKDMSVMAEQSLSVSYFPTVKKRSTLASKLKEEENWSHEQLNKRDEEEIELEEMDPLEVKKEYERQLAYYKHQIAQRFGTKREIAFFDTSNGWRIDSRDGIKRTNPT
jgi:hypothetical protein